MIQINLLPGAKKTRARGVSMNLGAITTGAIARVTDPHLLMAAAGMLLGAAAIAGMWWYQGNQATSLAEGLQTAEQDSIRFAAVIKEKRKTEAQRDSVMTQLALIRSIDGKRFVWPHIMDEINRALPSYTWITQVSQTTGIDDGVAAPAPARSKRTNTDTVEAPAKKNPAEFADSLASADRIGFRVVGNTVDIQALTRFMRILEASPFVEDVQLVKSSLVIADGKEVTEFQLDAAYQRPDSAAIQTTSLTVSVR